MRVIDRIKYAKDGYVAWRIYEDIQRKCVNDSFPFNKIIEKIGQCRSMSKRDAIGMLNDIWDDLVKYKIADNFQLANTIKAIKLKGRP